MKKTTVNGIKGALIATAAAGLFAACASSGAPKTAAVAPAAGGDIVNCTGINACKGHGNCAGAENACKAQNSCKGKGWVETSKTECAEKGGTEVTMHKM